MSRGQMLRGQMSPWQLESVLNVHRNLPLKFHQNRVSNSWDIADIEFVWWWVGWGGVCTVIILSKPQPNLNTRLGLTIKWLCTTTHHTNSMSAISQLLLTRFWWNFNGRFLGRSRTDSNYQVDICPGNICPDNICPYQEYLSCYWPDFD